MHTVRFTIISVFLIYIALSCIRQKFPVLLFVHGGAWEIGDRKDYHYIGYTFANHGIGTAVMSYRLSPQVVHPEHAKDVTRAFAWLYQTISQYKGQKNHIFLAGHSAGAHLCALIALDKRYLAEYNLSPDAIRGVICMSGIYDLSSMAKSVWGSHLITTAFGRNPDTWSKASPISYSRTGSSAPFLIMAAEKDFNLLKEQAEKFFDTLNTAQFFEISEKNHFSIVDSIGTQGDVTTEKILSFVAEHV